MGPTRFDRKRPVGNRPLRKKGAGLPDEGDDDEAKGEIGLADGGAGSLAAGMDEVLSEAEDEAGDIPVERM